MYTLLGTKGSYLTVTKDAVVVHTQSSNLFAGTYGSTTVTLPISILTGVEYVEPKLWKRGYITFGSYSDQNGYLTHSMGVKLRNKHRIESLAILLKDRIK
jgi:hypothetical protein